MDFDKLKPFFDRLAVRSLTELAKAVGCPLKTLRENRSNLKSLRSGPPYQIGMVVLELMAEGYLTIDQVVAKSGSDPNDSFLSLAAYLISTGFRGAEFGRHFENLFADPVLKPVLLHGDSERLQDAIRLAGQPKSKTWEPVKKSESLVIALSRPLTASLFFDRVWTLDREIPGHIGFRCGGFEEDLALGLIDGIIDDLSSFESNEAELAMKLEKVDDFLKSPHVEAQMSQAFAGLLAPSIARLSCKSVQSYFASKENLRATYQEGATSMVLTIIESMDWIDESKLSWEQVQSVREDKDSIDKLSRMLHWLDAEFAGKSLGYICDDFMIRLNDFGEATRKHGLQLVKGSLGSLLNVKSWNAIFAGIGGAILGSPQGPYAAALAALAVHGFQVAFETFNAHVDSKNAMEKNPIAYLHFVKEKTSSNQPEGIET